MSWKYNSSSTSTFPYSSSPSTREKFQSKFGLGNSKFSSVTPEGRVNYSSNLLDDSKFNRSFIEPSGVRAKTNSFESPASVQKLKERYNFIDDACRDKNPAKGKDLLSNSTKPYGRSYTTSHIDDNPVESATNYSKFRRKLEKPTSCGTKEGDLDRTVFGPRFGGIVRTRDTFKVPFNFHGTSRLPPKTCINDSTLNSTTPLNDDVVNIIQKENQDADQIVVTVVTRGTSPTPITSTIYLRSKRPDYGIEKRITRPRVRPETVHKEIQTDKEEISFMKYAYSCDSGIRSRSSYVNKYSSTPSHNSKYSSKGGFGSENRKELINLRGSLSPSECKRSFSREDSEEIASTPESPLKSPTGKPPLVKEIDRKMGLGKSPPSNFRLPLKPESPKGDLAKSPIFSTPPLQSKTITTELPNTPNKAAGSQSPAVTIDIMQAISNASSASESTEEDSTSNDESEEDCPAFSAKKSITNFLQNIPSSSALRRTNSNVYQRASDSSSHKTNLISHESGEKNWWESGENVHKVSGGITKAKNACSNSGQNLENSGPRSNNCLSIPNLASKHGPILSRDRSRGSCESESPREERLKSVEDQNGVRFGSSFAKGDQSNTLRSPSLSPQPLNSFPFENDSHNSMKFKLQADKSLGDGRRYLNDFPRECSVRNIRQKLSNGLETSPTEDKNHLSPKSINELLLKVKGELKSKPDLRKSSSREMSPIAADLKSEIELYWKELADSVNRPLRLCDLDFTDLNTDDESDIFGLVKTNGEVPAPPPMLILPPAIPQKTPGVPAPPTTITNQSVQRNFKVPPPPMTPPVLKNKKTVKLFWKEIKNEPTPVKLKTSDGRSQIWDELSTVNLDTQKLENLFESKAKDFLSKKHQDQFRNKEIIVLDPKRSNAINIGMTKLPPPRAIKTAILKMDSTVINKEGIEKVLTMLPTEEEKVRIQEAQNANPDIPLGSAEQFLLILGSISQLEARLRLWAFKLNFENSEREICEPLLDLKQGMEILRVNKTFRNILSTLLSVGNFLNGCNAKGFQIEYLSKVPEVKDTVHKHSLLHHICIILLEKFPESTDLYSEIGAVTRASKVDFDELALNMKKLEEDCKLSWNYLKTIAKHEGHTTMKVRMSDFLADCAERIVVLGIVYRRIMARFNKFAYWLGVPLNMIPTTRPNELFKIVSEFALEFRTTRDRVLQQIKKMNREKNRSRGHLIGSDNHDFKMNSKEAKDDAKLKQLLGKETIYGDKVPTWRRHRKDEMNILRETNQNEAEILETLIKTANQKTGLKERRRGRTFGKCCKFYF